MQNVRGSSYPGVEAPRLAESEAIRLPDSSQETPRILPFPPLRFPYRRHWWRLLDHSTDAEYKAATDSGYFGFTRIEITDAGRAALACRMCQNVEGDE